MIKILHRFFYAWIFLTKFPAPPLPIATKKDWGRISPYFVIVGSILGLFLFLLIKLFAFLKLPVMFSSLLIVFVWYWSTGCLHLDGLMDTFDGIGCQDKERKLEAIKDSRVGAFGAIGGIFIVLFKLIPLYTILLNKLGYVIIITTALSRLLIVYSFTFMSKKHNQEKGFISSSLILGGLKTPQDLFVNLISFILLLVFSFIFFKINIFFLVCILISCFLCLYWSYWLFNHFNGHSGDTYGAQLEVSEAITFCVAVLFRNILI